MGFEDSIDEFASRTLPTYRDELLSLVRIPSISQGDEHADDIRQVLATAKQLVLEHGFETADVVNTAGNPALVARLVRDPSAPCITIYNHMDVQPAREPQWQTDPFDPVVRDGKIIGRGATDDKGPALTIVHAIDFLKTNGHSFPNIQLVYETEEEIGSPNFGSFLDQGIQTGMLQKPDSILISDTIFEGDRPALTYKLRGMVRARLELELADHDVHSGISGGAAQNPLEILMRAVISCKDSNGTIQIPGFYDGVTELTPREHQALEIVARQFDVSRFKTDTGLRHLTTDDPRELLSRIWHQPTFEIHGYEGAQAVAGEIKSSIPYNVVAKITMRLVPGQDPEDILQKLERHMQGTHPAIRLASGGGQSAAITPIESPFMDAAAAACSRGFSRDALYVGCGGTIGSVPQFQRVWPGVPIVLLAQSLLSDGYHAPNEEFRLAQAQNGIKAMATYLNNVSGMRTR